jgi:SAM-dependent methyltransferase
MTTTTLPDKELERIRRTRRHPVRTQPDYLIQRFLVLHLERVLGEIRHPVDDVLDLWCGTQPYRDLVPPHGRYVAMDIDDRYGTPDVISDEFLPFPDASFDLILFTEAFHYLTDPRAGMEELARVLRPGGTLVLTVPLIILFAFSLSWVWTVLGIVMRSEQALMTLGNLVMFGITFVSNVFVPPDTLPRWLEAFVTVGGVDARIEVARDGAAWLVEQGTSRWA